MSEQRLKIGITQGDPNGIGWEVILKTLADTRMLELCTPVVYGAPDAMGHYRKLLPECEHVYFQTVYSAREARAGQNNLVICGKTETIETRRNIILTCDKHKMQNAKAFCIFRGCL